HVAVVAFKPRAVSQEAADVLEDAAVAAGAQFICSLQGTTLSMLRPGMLGRVGAFRFGKGRVQLCKPAGSVEACVDRARTLVAEANRKRYLSLDRERLMVRAARLQRNFAELRLARSDSRQADAALVQVRRAISSTMSAIE